MIASEEGELERVPESQLKEKVTNPFYTFEGFMTIVNRCKKFQKDKQITFIEIQKETDEF